MTIISKYKIWVKVYLNCHISKNILKRFFFFQIKPLNFTVAFISLQISYNSNTHMLWNLYSILTRCTSEKFFECVLWSLLQYTFVMLPISVQYHILAQAQTSPEPHHYSSVKKPAEGVSSLSIFLKYCIMTISSPKDKLIMNGN